MATTASGSDGEHPVSTPAGHHDIEKEGHSSVFKSIDGVPQVVEINSKDLPKGYFLRLNFMGTMAAAGLALAGGGGCFALIAPLLGIINADLGPDPNYLWIALVNVLTLAIGQVLVGRLTDLFGRRWYLILGSVVALVGTIICALAKNIPTLIGGNVLIGFASAPQQSYGFVISEIVPFKHRFLAMAYMYCWFTWLAFAPGIAFALVQHTKHTWRSCYYLMIGINAASVLLWYFFYYPPTFDEKYQHKKTKRQVIVDLDFFGLILLVGGLLIFLMGLSWGGSYYPWNSAHVIATIVIGFITLVAFVLYESLMPLKEPLVPMHLFKNIPWVAATLVVAFDATVYYAFAIVWPTMVFSVYTTSLSYGGLLCCVSGTGTNCGQLLCGALCRYLGKQRTQMIVTGTAMGTFLAACACATPFNHITVAVLLFLGTTCMGYMDTVGFTITGIANSDQAEIGTAMGLAGSMRSTISTIAQVIYTTILNNRLAKTIPQEVPPKLIAAGLPASSVPSFLAAIQVGTPAAFAKVQGLTTSIQATGIAAYKLASVHAYRTVFFSTIAFSVVCIICACFAPNVDDRMTDMVVVKIHHGKEDKDEEKTIPSLEE